MRLGQQARALLATLAAAAATAVSHAQAPPPVTLKIRWQPGRRLVQRRSIKSIQRMSLPGMAQPLVQRLEQIHDTALSVRAQRADGSHEVEMEILAVKFGMRVGRRVSTFDSAADSAGDAGNPYATVLRQLVGRRLLYTFSAAGEVTAVNGLDQYTTANSPVNGLFRENLYKQMMTLNMSAGLPAEPVTVGQTWTTTVRTPMPGLGDMAVGTRYTFVRWTTVDDRRCAQLDYTGAVELDTNAAGGKPAPGPVRVTATAGTVAGSTWFCPALGFPVRQQTTQTLTLTMTAGSSGAAPVKSELQQTVIAQLLRVETPAAPRAAE